MPLASRLLKALLQEGVAPSGVREHCLEVTFEGQTRIFYLRHRKLGVGIRKNLDLAMFIDHPKEELSGVSRRWAVEAQKTVHRQLGVHIIVFGELPLNHRARYTVRLPGGTTERHRLGARDVSMSGIECLLISTDAKPSNRQRKRPPHAKQ